MISFEDLIVVKDVFVCNHKRSIARAGY